MLGIAGRVGNFDPTGALLWIAGLEGGGGVTIELDAGGNFSLPEFGSEGARLRFELFADDRRVASVDAVQDDGPLSIVEPSADCLEVSDLVVFGRGGEPGATFASALRLHNGCSETLLLSTRLRPTTSPFQVAESPSLLLPGSSGDIVIFYTVPPIGLLSAEILFIDRGTFSDHAITLIAFGPET